MSKKTTVLMILDGFGLNDKTEGNAVAQAKKPNIDALMREYPFVKGNASGLAVGLPDGQMALQKKINIRIKKSFHPGLQMKAFLI